MKIKISGQDHDTNSAMAIYLMKFLEIEMGLGIELHNVNEHLEPNQAFNLAQDFDALLTIEVEDECC